MINPKQRFTRIIPILILCLAFLIPSVLVGASKNKVIESTKPQLRLQWYQDHVAMKENSWLKHARWQFLGPTNISGRMTDVEVVTPKGKNYTIYVAGASGGVWKTVNEGITWEPIFQHAASTSIGDLALSPDNPDVLWVGTGEANIFRSSMAGAGIYKTTDGGKTWKHLGLAGTHTIARILIHPENPDVVFVAATGHEWTDNVDRGVYKTTDGGKTWEKILYINERTGANDLVMDPTNPDILYAATWQRIRKKWNDPRTEPDYKETCIYKTLDGGKTWKAMDKGLLLPQHRGRIGIDLCKAKPNVLYAFIDDYEIIGTFKEGETDSYGRPKQGKIRGASVYRSDDAGENWHKVSEDNPYMEELSGTYGWVFSQIRVDPVNEDKIYVMGLFLNLSEDGGKTFTRLGDMHVDHHGLWIDPENPNYLVNVNDGGVAISYDGKHFRTFYDNLPLVQFFTVMYDMSTPFYIYGSVQDHGSYRGKVDLSHGRENIPAVAWEEAPGGEGSCHAIDPTDTDTVYSAYFYGSIARTDMKTKKTEWLVPKAPKGEPPYRGQWLAPFIISPHNPRIIYLGLNHLFRSMNRGDSWERISPDLTYNIKEKIGDIQYQTIFSVSESPLKFGLIYAGTDDGRVHVTHNSGSTWTEITKGLPYRKWVSRIQASAYDLGTVYMTQNGKRDDDFAAYIWKSTDFGKTWKDISGNIPCGPVNVIREDPKNKNILYVGTDLGVYITLDGGKLWHVMANDFPTTFVHDIVIHPRDSIMVAVTHGRGAWAMDVRNIQALTPEALQNQATLFKPCPAVVPEQSWYGWGESQKAYIYYFLKDASPVTLTVKDKDGKIVEQRDSSGDKGLNLICWDLTFKAGEKKLDNPYVKPGTYTLELNAGSVHLKETLEVKK